MATVTDAHPLVDAVALWEQTLRSELVERDEEIHLFAVALAAREHLFLLGKPGLAKTMTIERGVAYIAGVRSFVVQLGQLSTRDETEGPVSLKGLENDEERRKGDGYSTHVEICVWDEAFKSSKSLLNSALRLMQERKYKDNGVDKDSPLSTFVVCSNEERQSDEQEAFDDRLLLRKIVDRVRDRANVIRMLKTRMPTSPQPVITWDEWEQVQKEVDAMPVADEVYEMIADLERELLNAGIEITPRRLRKCIPIVQAEAFLEGAARAETEHVACPRALPWVKWPTSRRRSRSCSPRPRRCSRRASLCSRDREDRPQSRRELLAAAVAANVDPDTNEASTLQKELKQANRKLVTLAKEVGSSKRQRDLVERCRAAGRRSPPAAHRSVRHLTGGRCWPRRQTGRLTCSTD
jgi:MoxR-like ATPase